MFANKEEDTAGLQLGRAYKLNVRPPTSFKSSYVDFTFEATPYQFDYNLEKEEIDEPPVEEETEEENEETEEKEETPAVPPENAKGTKSWIWIVIAVAGCVVVAGIITLIVCLAKRRCAKKQKSEKISELRPAKLQKSELLFS